MLLLCEPTSSRARLAAFAGARCVQEAHVGHLHSGSSLGYQLPGSLSQLSSPLSIPLLHTQNKTFRDSCTDTDSMMVLFLIGRALEWLILLSGAYRIKAFNASFGGYT